MIRNLLISLLYSFLSIFIKRKDNIIAFGSWAGEMYADNSKYLLEYILKNYPGRFKLYWVGNKSIENSIPQGVTFLEKDKLSTGIILLKAKYFFCTQMHRADICKYNVYQGCKIIYLDHGLAIKRWAMDIVNYNGELEEKNIVKRIYHFVTGESKKYDYFATSSPLMDKVYCSSLKYRGSSIEKMLQCGIPRNDYLIDNKDNQEEILRIKDKYSKLLGFDKKKKIGYIQISQFEEVSYDQFTKALDDLKKQGMKAVIFDVRSNPGGLYETVCKMLDEILPEGNLVSTKDKYGNEEKQTSDSKCLDMPMVVLQNKDSASASEIFAGAIQDFNAGKIVGTQSFGKGIVQTILPLSDGSAVKLTVQDYYTPSGKNIHGKGITPDVEVELEENATSDTQLEKAKETIMELMK